MLKIIIQLFIIIQLIKPKPKYLIEYLDKAIQRDKNNKLLSLYIDDENLLQKYKAIWAKIKGLKN